MEFRRLARGDEAATTALFAALEGEPFFRPHEFTPDAAREVCAYEGRDGHYAGFDDEGVIMVYGLLRGWDAGFQHPSLGIAVHQDFRGRGHGGCMMDFLRQEAMRLGADRIRLRVHPDNRVALALYAKLGYQFSEYLDRGEWVAWYHLGR